MSAMRRARRQAVGLFLVSTAFAALVAFACEPGAREGPAAPMSKVRPPDRTEVTMEVTPFDAAGPEGPSPGTSPAAVPAVASAAGAAPPEAANPSGDGILAGPDPSVEKAVAAVRPRLRACYKKALATAPKLSGTATFDATMSKEGHVSSARFVKREGLSEDMVGCLLTAVKAMTFEPGKKSQIVTLSFGSPGSADAGAKH